MRVQDVAELLTNEARFGTDSDLTNSAMELARQHVAEHSAQVRRGLSKAARINTTWQPALAACDTPETASKDELATMIRHADLKSINLDTYREEHHYLVFPFEQVSAIRALYQARAQKARQDAEPYYETMLYTMSHPHEENSGQNFTWASHQFAGIHIDVQNAEKWDHELAALPLQANVPTAES